MRSMRSRVPEKSELAAQLKRYRYDAGLKGEEAGSVIGKKATTVYKYEAGTLWVSPEDLRALLNEYGVSMSRPSPRSATPGLEAGRRTSPPCAGARCAPTTT